MGKVFNKEILRSITSSLGRFLALAVIVALGAGFYAGLRMTAPDMKIGADSFYDGTALYDINVISTLGLTDDDVAALQAIDGVENVTPGYQTDMVTEINDTTYTMRIHSLDIAAAQASDTSDGTNALSNDAGYLNRPLLMEGSWPTKSGECVLGYGPVMGVPAKIGDTVTVLEGTQDPDDVLVTKQYTVVGFVKSSIYTAHTNLGTTALGSGIIQQYMFIPESDFKDGQPYSVIYLTVAGAQAELSGSDAYQSVVSAVEDRINAQRATRELARMNQLKSDAQATLDDEWADFDKERQDALDQLADAKSQLDDAANTLADSQSQLEEGQASYDDGVAQLAQKRQDAATGFAQAKSQLDDKQAQLDAADAQFADGKAQMDAAWQAYNDQLAQWQAAYDALDPADPDYALNAATLDAWKDQLDSGKATLDGEQAALDAQQAQLQDAHDQLAAGWASYQAQQQQANAGFASAQAQLDSSSAQLASGWDELAAGQQEYNDNLDAYNQKKADAEKGYAEAIQKLDDAQVQIDTIEAPTWYVMDRTKNSGAVSFQTDAGRVDQISQVFPLLFFLVAALVALTTMTRMVEEERVLIGTYKALGYGRARITSKYLVYGLIASGVGAAIGIAILSQALPRTIFFAYSIMYDVPPCPTPNNIPHTALSAGLGIGITLVATWAAVTSTLRESPAALMLPRAPKAGKRILLERIAPLWRRLSFSWKVTFRNIFRYKKRFIMTIIGIAGCSALLLTGLGLYDAINDIIAKQYSDITHYNTTVRMADDISADDRSAVDAVLSDKSLITESTLVQEDHMTARSSANKDFGVYVIVPADPGQFKDFVDMHERVGKAPLALDDNSIIVSEKVAVKLGLSKGDTLYLVVEDAMGNPTDEKYAFTVGGIMENYIASYIYISPGNYTKTTGKDPDLSMIIAKSTTDSAGKDKISNTLLALDGVKTVAYTDETINSYQKMLTSVNSIVWVLVTAAAILAFVVLYNLTNINITERQREIATLKVLGFIPREVYSYIFREIMLLAGIGALFGLALGVLMENFVVTTAEVDYVMFGREIHPLSFVIAFALTLAYAAIISLVMRVKLKHINMVESLKSVE
ncbi:MAG: ABC transporter permease [Eggerthellaceae bacterium]|nr:ABC transporter permease [Eggerthellaceae bacterium]